tara:strand:- start:1076 stop:1426 length:351 start_codon:yes stop_codon:yes gene_type:complete
LHIINIDILNNFLIYYSLIILVFIGAMNWSLEANSSNLRIIYGFIPSFFAIIIIFLNLYSYNQQYIFFSIILFLLLQVITDYFFLFKKTNYLNIFYFLRLPLTSIIIFLLYFNLFL